jgi:hypothetical protein
VWKEDRHRVEHAAEELLERLKLATNTGGAPRAEATVADAEALTIAIEQFQLAFDRRNGGFGDAPKFPRPSELLFLLREHARRTGAGHQQANAGDSRPGSAPERGTSAALLMVLDTLRAMALGGMRDHIGGGFHRYSVDAEWRVPHFEKMLYDQAQLVLAYLETAQATGEDFFATVAEDTLHYVMRDLTDPLGGFYSAEDADSIPPEHAADPSAHKSEGAFYIWSAREIDDILGDDAAVARRRFGIEPNGNAPQDPQGEFLGKNLLYVSQSIEDIAVRSGMSPEQVMEALSRTREKLAAVRAGRPRPHLDDKILTAWNGLMIAAFARAARVLVASPAAARYLAAAQRAAAFINAHLWRADSQRLLRRYRDGDAAIDAYAEDYAYLIFGLLELFQADGNPRWLEWAIGLQQRQDALFWDSAQGGWFSTTGEDPTVLLRLKEDYDGAEPAPSSVSVLNLITLNHLGADVSLDRAERTLGRYGQRIGAAARVVPMMLAALSSWHAEHTQVALVGPADGPDTRALGAELARHYRPFTSIVPVTPEHQQAISRLLPFVGAMAQRNGRATAYVCRNFACQEPVDTPEALTVQV